MIILYMLVSLLGATFTAAALWSGSWWLALLCAPLGGSALALLAAIGIAAFRWKEETLTEGDAVFGGRSPERRSA
jgi:hypothetical protein